MPETPFIKELCGKMVICLCLSMIGDYLCLLLKTCETEALSVSKENLSCLTLGNDKKVKN